MARTKQGEVVSHRPPSPSTNAAGIDESQVLNFLYKPHTISAMIVAGVILVYFAFTRDESAETATNVKSGILAGSMVFLLFSMLQFRDGIFRRPHPAVWRVVMGAAVLYLIALVFLLFQSKHDARQLMRYIDPKLGVALPERSYAEHCELYTPNDPVSRFRNLYDTVNDEFIWAHLIGWWGKTILIRDPVICWTISILFEVWEVTFQHMLPNFAECWWDHIILDIIVCNGLGIWLGMKTCRWLEMKVYDWPGQGDNAPGTPRQTVWMKALKQFTPYQYDEFRWEMLKDYKRLFAVVVVLFCFSVVELNAFFLKYLLWIPPPHPINIWRLVLWAACALPGLREYYQFVTDNTNKKFGTMSWLCCALVGMETLISIKFGQGEFPEPAPKVVLYPWIAFIVLFLVTSVVYFSTRGNGKGSNTTGGQGQGQEKRSTKKKHVQ